MENEGESILFSQSWLDKVEFLGKRREANGHVHLVNRSRVATKNRCMTDYLKKSHPNRTRCD